MSHSSVIAIVEDDQAVRDALVDLLEVEGFATCAFPCPKLFLKAACDRDFGCVISDVRMPEVGGLELQRRLLGQGLTVPVIFITSLIDEALEARARQCGAAAWFTKPVPDTLLLHTVRNLLEPPRHG